MIYAELGCRNTQLQIPGHALFLYDRQYPTLTCSSMLLGVIIQNGLSDSSAIQNSSRWRLLIST